MTIHRVLCAAIVVLLLTSPLAAEMRPISDAEHAAVRIAADYLSRGPAAIAEQLSASSPLKGLPPSELLAEIEVRFGPREGAQWELQTVVPALKDRMAAFAVSYPSGFDDALILQMVKEGSDYKIVRSSRRPRTFRSRRSSAPGWPSCRTTRWRPRWRSSTP